MFKGFFLFFLGGGKLVLLVRLAVMVIDFLGFQIFGGVGCTEVGLRW